MYIRAIRFDSPQAAELLWKLVQDKEFFPRLKARAAQEDADAQFVWAGLVALRFDQVLAQGGAYLTGPQAFNLLRKAVAQNHVQALIETGLCYYAGRWVALDQEKAVQMWKQAASLGSREAQIRSTIVEMRERKDATGSGDAVAKLAQWMDEGSVLAGVGLGYCYEAGLGVAQSKAIAARFYRAAAQRGSQDAYRALRRMHDEIRPEGKEFKLED
jgi:TPR repeat protein